MSGKRLILGLMWNETLDCKGHGEGSSLGTHDFFPGPVYVLRSDGVKAIFGYSSLQEVNKL